MNHPTAETIPGSPTGSETESNQQKKRRLSNSPVNSTTTTTTSTSTSASTSNETRKLAQASRTLRACELCRKQKTRCFRSPEYPTSCLRCRFLSKTCSFKLEESESASTTSTNAATIDSQGNFKVDLILDRVNELLSIVKSGQMSSVEHAGNGVNTPGQDQLINSDARLLLETASSMQGHHQINSNSLLNVELLEQTTLDFQSATPSFVTAPFTIVRNSMKNEFCPASIQNLYQSRIYSHSNRPSNIIELGIMTEKEVIDVVGNFRRNYGRWVSFPNSLSTENLVRDLQEKSPLLLTTCCCVSYRYSAGPNQDNQQRITRLAKVLIKELSHNFTQFASFANNDYGLVEFFQSLAVLSLYAGSISSVVTDEDPELAGFNLDPWQLSSIGITTFLTKSTFQLFKTKRSNTEDGYETLTILRIYNHLCLVHLINSIFSGRPCILDDGRIRYCTTALTLFNATNFDGRMVSEINILYITYKYLQKNDDANNAPNLQDFHFNEVVKEIQTWFQNWEYLIQQPALQFAEFNYHFCSILIYLAHSFQKLQLAGGAGGGVVGGVSGVISDLNMFLQQDILDLILKQCQPQNLLSMYQHARDLLEHIKQISSESYFAYLSDQLHFCFYFSGVLLSRILRLAVTSNLSHLEEFKDVNTKRGLTRRLQPIVNLTRKIDGFLSDSDPVILAKYNTGLKHCIEDVLNA
ncbi:hypothetical protein KGF57_002341 [Candida theae]|uniref:Zn(2)-C6 fungal-type domain-containing protein n=1 Tax=Candida theae TaxID=1198502 RepID=A0AAD5BFE8_9ASCO|nr:uncharacterized protein KGF57_002341 [Candida theae]KAI5958907.1 hypothetical protein KGF57_002341 [Candida theae]